MPRKSKSAKSSNTGTQALQKLQRLDVDASPSSGDGGNGTALVDNDAHLLRQSISSLYRAGSTLRSYRYASRKVEPNLGTEQLWSQLQILYAPTIKKMENAFESTQNFENLAEKLQKTEERAKELNRLSSRKSSKNNNKKSSKQHQQDDDDDDDDDVNLFTSRKKQQKLPRDLAQLAEEDEERRQRKKLAKQGLGMDGTSRVGNYAFGLGNNAGTSADGKKRRGGGGNDDDDVDNELLEEEFGAGVDEDGENAGEASLFSNKNKSRRQNSFDRYDDDAEYDADDLLDDEADDEELLRRAKKALKDDPDAADFADEHDDEEEYEDDEEGMFDDEEGEEDEEFIDEDGEDAKAMKEMYGTFDADDFDENNNNDEDHDGDDDDEYNENKLAYDEQESLEDEEDRKIDSDEIRKAAPQTAFERAEQERQSRIQKAEQDRLAGNWEMSGEVAAIDRPRDALLETELIMEHAMPTAPIITETLTLKLEERLKRRILAGNFDDVIRKNPKLVHFDEKDAKVLQREKMDEQAQKSKASLVDLYEKEFLEKQRKAAGGGEEQQQAEPLTQVEQDELKVLQQWRRISQHLDALSNFFFTPKPVSNDLDARVRAVQDQAPAISVESKGMFALSKEKVLAPQDVFRPKKGQAASLTVSKDEMTPTEKRGVRAAQKRSYKVADGLKEKRQGERQKKINEKKKEQDQAVQQD